MFDQLTARAIEKVGRLQRELDEAKKDAERYRWLRSRCTWEQATSILNDAPSGIDAAIDKAMSK